MKKPKSKTTKLDKLVSDNFAILKKKTFSNTTHDRIQDLTFEIAYEAFDKARMKDLLALAIEDPEIVDNELTHDDICMIDGRTFTGEILQNQIAQWLAYQLHQEYYNGDCPHCPPCSHNTCKQCEEEGLE